MTTRRKPPAHLPNLGPNALRRKEERRDAPAKSDPMAWKSTAPDLERRRREDAQDLSPGTAICSRCGADVQWSITGKSRDHPKNRDGTDHHASCQPRTLAMPTLTVSGPRNATTDPRTGLRFYEWNGTRYPSVTTIQRMAGVPFGLHNWAINQVIQRVVTDSRDIEARLATARDTPQWDSVRTIVSADLRAASTEERDRAARLGTAVHDAAEKELDPAGVAPELQPRLRQYKHWLEVSGAETLASEFQVWNTTVGYAGTVDRLCRMRDGSIFVVDLKTGKGVYSDHLLQLMAYTMAEFSGGRDPDGVDRKDDATTDFLLQASAMAVLHLADDHWEFIQLKPDPKAWAAFRGLLAFALWMKDHPDAASITLASRKGSAA